MVRRVASSLVLLIYFKIICRSVVPPACGAVHSRLYQIACPVLFEVCPLMVRVRTMLLIRKSRKLIAQYASERQCNSVYASFFYLSIALVGTPTLAWLTQCSEICTELGERVQMVTRLIAKFTAANDHDNCVSLRMCSLVCLSNLGELYHILVHHPLWKLPSVTLKQHEQTMYRMSDISKELMNDNDMRHLPPYAGVSTSSSHVCSEWADVPTHWQCSWVRAATLLRKEISMMVYEGYISHPEKSVDEMRKCIGATISFMTATSDKFHSVSSFENPSKNWGELIPTE
jgi:hypothetical protein